MRCGIGTAASVAAVGGGVDDRRGHRGAAGLGPGAALCAELSPEADAVEHGQLCELVLHHGRLLSFSITNGCLARLGRVRARHNPSTCLSFFERVGWFGASDTLSVKLAQWKARFRWPRGDR